MVSRRRRRFSQKHAEQILCVSVLCANISHAKAQSFAKRLRGSAQSACNIFTQESTEDTEFSTDLLVSTGIF